MKTQNFNYAPPLEEGLFRHHHDPIPRGTKLLDKYTVERTLGQGGMGIVVAARHDALGELVAIKFLLPAAMMNRQAVGRFLREARASARLRSEHVVRVQDVGELETGEPYMIMEYLEGEDLKSIVRKNGPRPILEAVDYLLQACRGVGAAHAKNIVHRDLKPANLFLTKNAEGAPLVKVFDFGIARIIDANEEDLTTNDILGSLPYMSPEQLLKSRTADWRTDIWSLGVILYELLTTKRPFDGEGRGEFVQNIMNAEPVPLAVWRDDVPGPVEAVIGRCLYKDRNARYQSTDELARALCEAIGLPPPMRAPMASISISESCVGPEMAITPNPSHGQPPPAKSEQTQPTHAGMSITGQPPVSLRIKRARVALAAGGALLTSVGVVGLVVALRSSGTEQTPVNASAGPQVSAHEMVLVVPTAAVSAKEVTERATIELGDEEEEPAAKSTDGTNGTTAEQAPTNTGPMKKSAPAPSGSPLGISSESGPKPAPPKAPEIAQSTTTKATAAPTFVPPPSFN